MDGVDNFAGCSRLFGDVPLKHREDQDDPSRNADVGGVVLKLEMYLNASFISLKTCRL